MIMVFTASPPISTSWDGAHIVYSNTCGTGGFFDASSGTCLKNDINVIGDILVDIIEQQIRQSKKNGSDSGRN